MSANIFPNRNRKPRWRSARRREMKQQGVTPAERLWIWHVRLGALAEVPEWARRNGVRGLGQTTNSVWLWPVDGRRLVIEDRAVGGMPQVNVAEMRACKVCGRPLVGQDAERRRKMDESGPGGRTIPCGEQCERDRDSRVWAKLVRGKREEAA